MEIALEWWLAYLALGIVVGFFAGLFGIGGGLIMVPVLTFLFTAQHFPPEKTLHLALGTAMACIAFTALSSLRTHHIYTAVNWSVVKHLTPGIVLGTLLGSTLASLAPARPLGIFFALFVFFAATQSLLDVKPKASRSLPGKLGMWAVGGIIGGISSMVSIGGGLMTIPFLTFCNVSLRHAIGTAAAVGFPIAVAGAIGYAANGMMYAAAMPDQLPAHSLGYIYLPALGGIVLTSVLTASLGAKTTHVLPTKVLKKVFAVFLYVLATKMLIGLL